MTNIVKKAFILDNTYAVVAIMNVQDTYVISGFYLITINDGVYCVSGSYYNPEDGLFYDDAEYTIIDGEVVSDDSYSYSASGG